MIKVFIDESGTHAGSPALAFAAYCGKPKEWKKFTTAWNIAKRPINVFHSVDCQNLSGEFKGWTKEDRDALVSRLLAVLPKHQLVGLAIGVNLRDLDEALAEKQHLKEMFGPPYAMCLHHLLSYVIELMEKTNNNQSIAFIHETNDYQSQALEVFEAVCSRRKKHSSKITMTFADKSDFVPLQAADVLAYEANKRGRDPLSPNRRRSLEALGDGKISIRGFSKPNMDWLVSRLSILHAELEVFGKVVTFFPEEDLTNP